jgi:hypothetical protein
VISTVKGRAERNKSLAPGDYAFYTLFKIQNSSPFNSSDTITQNSQNFLKYFWNMKQKANQMAPTCSSNLEMGNPHSVLAGKL